MSGHRKTGGRPHSHPLRTDCRGPGCERRSTKNYGFCDACWFELPVARRLVIEEAREDDRHREFREMRWRAARWLGAQRSAAAFEGVRP